MNVKERLAELLTSLNLKQYQFAKGIGVQPASVSEWLNKPNSNPTVESLIRISKSYNVSIQWLLTGEGSMFNSVRASEPSPSRFVGIDIIPDIAAGTGYDCSNSEPLYTLSLPAHILHLPGPYYGFRVTGDSMEPDIKDQDIVILSGTWQGVSPDGRICGFRNSDGMVLKRLVLDHKKQEGWLFSINQAYKPIRYGKNTQDLVMIGVLCALIRDYLLE